MNDIAPVAHIQRPTAPLAPWQESALLVAYALRHQQSKGVGAAVVIDRDGVLATDAAHFRTWGIDAFAKPPHAFSLLGPDGEWRFMHEAERARS